jgi:alpha-1,4-digalacturonate transport system permease protein
MNKTKSKVAWGAYLYDAISILLCLLFLIPILWVLFSAFIIEKELFVFPPDLRGLSLEHFIKVFRTGNIVHFAWNSLVVACLSSLITMLISSMAGFALAKYKFRGRKLIFFLILSTLLVPLQVLMVPVFIVLKSLGWINTLVGIIIPPAATPTGTFLMRQYMFGIPNELIESARIDGASDWKIYWHIILPLSAPALAALGILSFTWRWNDYLWPLIVESSQDKFTLQLSLANLIGTNTVEWGTLLAYAVLILIPVLIIFLTFQRYFLKGSLTGSIK